MSIKIDGSKVRFWPLKRQAVAAAKSIGWLAKDVMPVHTRFVHGWAISVPGVELTFLSQERFGELFHASEKVRRPLSKAGAE
jgi:hypothetical protein